MPFSAALRRRLAAALLVAVAVTAALLHEPARSQSVSRGARAVRGQTETAHGDGGAVLVVGDSLAVGLKPSLGRMLAPRRVVWDARSGRTTPQGLVHLRARLREVTPKVVVVSLGTNDGADPARFTSRIGRALHAIGPGACVVWSDINRPPRKGPYRALNHALRAEAAHHRRLVIVDWNRAVLAHEVALPDGLHPDSAGFAYRSRLIADAIARHCPAS